VPETRRLTAAVYGPSCCVHIRWCRCFACTHDRAAAPTQSAPAFQGADRPPGRAPVERVAVGNGQDRRLLLLAIRREARQVALAARASAPASASVPRAFRSGRHERLRSVPACALKVERSEPNQLLHCVRSEALMHSSYASPCVMGIDTTLTTMHWHARSLRQHAGSQQQHRPRAALRRGPGVAAGREYAFV
jgi:hypothetical protein